MDIEKYWKYTLEQNAEAMRSYFEKGAVIKWHNSNEYFTVDEFKNSKLSFHVTSFIEINNDKIISIDEYWGDDGAAPEWRLNKHIGKPIK